MSTRNDILEQLKNDIEDYIKVSRDYNTDVAEVKRGIQQFEEMVNKPAVAFWNYKDELLEQYHGTEQLRCLRIYLYCYCDTDGYRDFEDIHNLVDDVWSFLYDDFTHKDSTIINDVTIFEGGISDPVAMAELEIEIKYTI